VTVTMQECKFIVMWRSSADD